jgi:hypothetical protein
MRVSHNNALVLRPNNLALMTPCPMYMCLNYVKNIYVMLDLLLSVI